MHGTTESSSHLPRTTRPATLGDLLMQRRYLPYTTERKRESGGLRECINKLIPVIAISLFPRRPLVFSRDTSRNLQAEIPGRAVSKLHATAAPRRVGQIYAHRINTRCDHRGADSGGVCVGIPALRQATAPI